MIYKNIIRLLLPALTVALAAAACTPRLEIPDRVGDDGWLTGESPAASEAPIEFAVGEGTKGQAPITTLTELAKRDFSVSAWYVAPGKAFRDGDATRIAYIANHRFGYLTNDPDHDAFSDAWRGVAAHAATTGAAAAAPVYWPLDGSLTFFCFAPYRADAALDTPPVPDTRDIVLEAPVTDAGVIARLPGYLPGSPLLRVTPAAAAADQVDFLAAPAVLDKRRTDNAGRFPLDLGQHRMTSLDFQFNYDDSYEDSEHNIHHYLSAGESVRVLSIVVRDVIGSKYLYFTGGAPYEAVWSDAVSPADKETASTPLPTVTYTLNAVKNGSGELGYGYEYELPEKSGSNYKAVVLDKGHLYLLPQTLSDEAALEISYAVFDGTNYKGITEILSLKLNSGLAAWQPGTKVTYKITLNIKPYQSASFTVLVEKWLFSGNDHPETELLPDHD